MAASEMHFFLVPLEECVVALPRQPDCLIAHSCTPWTACVCDALDIPRLVLHCMSAYFLLCMHNLSKYGVYDRVGDDEMEEFEVPEILVRACGNKATLRGFFQWPSIEKEHCDMLGAEASANRLIMRTFRGIEGAFVDAYAAALGRMMWAVMPTCAASGAMGNADAKAGRGNRADGRCPRIVSWLEARPPASVLHISFGSIAHLPAKQVEELARGQGASWRTFVWAIEDLVGTEKEAAGFAGGGNGDEGE